MDRGSSELGDVAPGDFRAQLHELADWIASRIPGMSADHLRRYAATCGIVIDGQLIAGMAWSGVERGNVEITFAAHNPRWATRETINAFVEEQTGQLRHLSHRRPHRPL